MFEKYGSVARLVMPPSMTMALIEFLEPSEARHVCKLISCAPLQIELLFSSSSVHPRFCCSIITSLTLLPLSPHLAHLPTRSAFRKLAYRKFKDEPLYLEWAPEGCFTGQAAPAETSSKPAEGKKENASDTAEFGKKKVVAAEPKKETADDSSDEDEDESDEEHEAEEESEETSSSEDESDAAAPAASSKPEDVLGGT
jgi:hypothetical protein